MTDITELAPAMKAAATEATLEKWYVDNDFDVCSENYGFVAELHGDNLVHNAQFIAVANPANILALLEALEKAQQHIARQEQIILNQDESLSIRRAELEKAQAQSSKWLEAYHKAVSIGARYEERIAELESRTVTVKLPPLNDDLISILGRPNFMCAHLAELLRKSGEDIKRKSEHEQAAVIHWFLGIYLEHGDKWEGVAKSDMQARAAGIKWEAE